MQITRTSMFSGITRTREMPTVTEERLARWQGKKELIQNVFPDLSSGDREFLMTGVTEEEWDAMFANHDEDKYPSPSNIDWAVENGDLEPGDAEDLKEALFGE